MENLKIKEIEIEKISEYEYNINLICFTPIKGIIVKGFIIDKD